MNEAMMQIMVLYIQELTMNASILFHYVSAQVVLLCFAGRFANDHNRKVDWLSILRPQRLAWFIVADNV
jgi:hypothetical protein